MLSNHQCLPCNIYNMDEVGFLLSSSHSVRAVAPRVSSIKAQALLPDDVHITTVLAIGVGDAPIPLLLLYPGEKSLGGMGCCTR